MQNNINSFFRKLLDLREGAEEKDKIIENIKDDSNFSSARFWTLVFAIGLASVGLNVNSIPVIIGAMLISPIMGPIVSMGLSLAINDWNLMRRSLRNFLILTIISISVSALYFLISPITNAQSELLARIQPTIFDVLIAVFGGMVGFIGLSRNTRYNNIIPGVAIATALIPPLCTVGYGIASFQPKFIIGAFYLFLINCIFICLSSLFIAKFLELPKVEYPNIQRQKQIRKIITFIILIMVTPAIYLAHTFVQQNNFNQNVDRFIKDNFENNGYVVIYKNISYSTTPKSIDVAFLSKRFNEDEISALNSKLSDYGLSQSELRIRQNGLQLTDEEWRSILTEVENDKNDISKLVEKIKIEKKSFLSSVKILEEAKAVNSSISNIAMGSMEYGDPTEENGQEFMVALVYYDADLVSADKDIISNWLKTRTSNYQLGIYFVPGQNYVAPTLSTSTPKVKN